MEQYKRLIDETEYEYIYRICKQKDIIGTWNDVRDILNEELNYDYSESKYRKSYQAFEKMFAANQKQVSEADKYLEDIKEQKRELEKERKKLQTEKIEYNRWLREDARNELMVEKIIDAIKEIQPLPCPKKIEVKQNERYGILNIADCHFDKEFVVYGLNNEIINEYSPEIFFQRMELLLSETVDYIKKENLSSIKVFNLGDSLDGFLRHSQLWHLRYGVIKSAIIFGKYMGSWLNKLSQYVNVEYHQTVGNHGELRMLDGKKNAHENENIEFVTGEIIKILNENNPNFTFVGNKTGLIFTTVDKYNILGIHGEIKDLAKAIKDFSDIYDVKISYIIAGHKHHSEFNNCGVRKGCIGVGSIVGSDDFSFSLRKAADATASFVIFEKDKGKTDEHTFVLN